MRSGALKKLLETIGLRPVKVDDRGDGAVVLRDIGRILTAGVATLAVMAGSTPAEAVAKTTHCGVKTTWRLVDSEDNSAVKVRLWWKPSAKAGWLAFCGEAWDLEKSPHRVILQMQPNNRAWTTSTGSNSTWRRWDAPTKGLYSYYAEANLAYDTTTGAVWVVHVR